jgi:hypothetical protein
LRMAKRHFVGPGAQRESAINVMERFVRQVRGGLTSYFGGDEIRARALFLKSIDSIDHLPARDRRVLAALWPRVRKKSKRPLDNLRLIIAWEIFQRGTLDLKPGQVSPKLKQLGKGKQAFARWYCETILERHAVAKSIVRELDRLLSRPRPLARD